MKERFDLIFRVEEFGKNIIRLAKTVPKNVITLPILSQLIRSGTSIGANYCEADNAESKNDFIHKLGIARKEAKETCFWLRMLIESEPKVMNKSEVLQQESKELNLILNAIIKKATGTVTRHRTE